LPYTVWVTDPDQHFRCGNNILFVSHPLDSHDLLLLIREVWHSFLEDRSALDNAMDKIFSEVDFTNYL
jgi:hypothetical protein